MSETPAKDSPRMASAGHAPRGTLIGRSAHRVATPIGPATLVGDEDGGLAKRQMFRRVKDLMASAKFRRERKRMACRDCMEAAASKGAASEYASALSWPRTFRSWASLRDHLIVYHNYDARILPE
jgi:hypothetical protein